MAEQLFGTLPIRSEICDQIDFTKVALVDAGVSADCIEVTNSDSGLDQRRQRHAFVDG